MGRIAKGTLVTVTTNNGGEITGRLQHDYDPSFAVDLDVAARPILAHRIIEVAPVPAPSTPPPPSPPMPMPPRPTEERIRKVVQVLRRMEDAGVLRSDSLPLIDALARID